MDPFAAKRQEMIAHQLVARGIKQKRVLDAMSKLPRHIFISERLAQQAYEDHPLPIRCKQTISQPYMVALMTECLDLKGMERVLEVGTGSGYQTAILASLAKDIYTIECEQELSEAAKSILVTLRIDNVRMKMGDGTLGWPELAPFDGIVVTAAASDVPKPLLSQLAEGGRLIIPVGRSAFSQTLKRITKISGKFKEEEICSCVFVKLMGEYGWGKIQ